MLPDVNPWWLLLGGAILYAAIWRAGWAGALVTLFAYLLAGLVYWEIHRNHEDSR